MLFVLAKAREIGLTRIRCALWEIGLMSEPEESV